MSKVSGGALAAQVMKNEGIEALFGIIGGHIYPIVEGCAAEGIKVIDTRHEQSGAHMAEAWALTTGNMAACIGTAGPGFTNMLTGIANAYLGASPMLAIGGRAAIHEFDTGALQDFGQLDVITPMTKWARAIYQTERIPEYVGMALRQARSGRPGPVYLEIPMDRAFAEVDPSTVSIPDQQRIESRPAGNPRDIERALELIDKAERPVVVASGGVWWSQGQDAFKDFVEKIDAPFYTRGAGRGCVSDSHPLSMGGALGPLPAGAFAAADLVVLVGSRFNFTFEAKNMPPNLKVVRIDIEESALCDGRTPDVGIVGDARTVLEQLVGGMKKASHKEWVEQLKTGQSQMAQMIEPMLNSDQSPIHPLRLFSEIGRFVDENTILAVDGGDMCVWGNLVLPAPGPGQFLSIVSSILGCLGIGVPFGIAAKVAHPDKQVIVTTGDGSFGLTMMEYDTAIRHNIPFVTVIGNDSCWGMIERPMKRDRGNAIATGLAPRRYDKMVEAMGGYGELVEKPEDIGPAIQRAIDSGVPACVNVLTDPEIGPDTGTL